MNPLGYGLGGYGAGEYGFVEDDSNEPEPMPTCKGTKTNGNPCSLPAGWGTDNEEYCMYHEDQATDDTDGDSGGGGDDTTTQSPLYSTDETNAADRIIVAETSADIQPTIDYCANNDIRGVIQLLPKTYTPDQQIELKGTVIVRGAAPVNMRGPSAVTTIQADNIADGNAVIRYRTNDEELKAHASEVRNLQIRGQRKDGKSVHGIECGFVGNPRIVDCIVYECERHGIIIRGTQSGELERVVVERCGDQANDWHGLDLGGVVRDGGAFNRATVLGSVSAINGPTSDATPLKLRNGSTLRIKSDAVRTGIRGHGTELNGPTIDIDGGDLIGDNILITTNLHVHHPAIHLHNSGTLRLHNSVVEKGDPNILFESGSMSLSETAIKRAKDHGDGGHGIVVADSGKTENDWDLADVSYLNNPGYGLVAGRVPGRALGCLSFASNTAGCIKTDRSIRALDAANVKDNGPLVTGSGEVLTPQFAVKD